MTEKLFLEDSYRTAFDATVTAVSGNEVQLDRTAFYAASGGQPGDTGTIIVQGRAIPVTATRKGEGLSDIWHVLSEDAVLSVGDSVRGDIGWDIRHRHMRMHTCLHLLCALVTGDVTGGAIAADKGRLDFNINADAVEKEALEEKLNALIDANHPVSTEWITDEDLAANPSLIRTMSVKPPSGGGRIRLVRIGAEGATVDLQPCGGTHVRETGEIGRVGIAKIENKGKQNRRISVVFAG